MLHRSAVDALKDQHSATYTALLHAVGSSLSDRLRRANSEIRALAR